MPSSGQSKVYREQGSTGLVVASGGRILFEAGGSLQGLGVAGVLPGNLASGSVPLGAHLWGAREVASGETLSSGSSAPTMFWQGLLGIDTTPAIALSSSGDQSGYLNWASANVDGIKLPPIAMPPDLSSAGGLRIDLKGESIGTGTASDAAAGFDVRCWSGVGDVEMGSTHPNFSSTPSWQTVNIASGDITTGALNITLVPLAHAGRAIRLYDMRMRYTRTS